MAYSSDVIQVYANDSRGSTGHSKAHCRYCGQPVTWFVTVANQKAMPIDGHEPVPLRSDRETATGRTIEIHDRATVHFATCQSYPRGRKS